MVQVVAHHVVVGLFNLNKEYISKSLCENRNKPSKKCNGKCYLKKQLKKVQDTEQGSSDGSVLKIEKTEVFCLIPAPPAFIARPIVAEHAVKNPVATMFVEQVNGCSIFHPPSTLC